MFIKLCEDFIEKNPSDLIGNFFSCASRLNIWSYAGICLNLRYTSRKHTCHCTATTIPLLFMFLCSVRFHNRGTKNCGDVLMIDDSEITIWDVCLLCFSLLSFHSLVPGGNQQIVAIKTQLNFQLLITLFLKSSLNILHILQNCEVACLSPLHTEGYGIRQKWI